MKNLKLKKIIEIKNLVKKYGKKIVFNKLNLDIFEGERIALLGANGCGKTTLMETICGLRKVDGGYINFPQGKELFFKSVGMQFQTGNYPNAIRVNDLIYLYSNVYNQPIDKNLKKEFQIDEIEYKDVNDLSFGQKKE